MMIVFFGRIPLPEMMCSCANMQQIWLKKKQFFSKWVTKLNILTHSPSTQTICYGSLLKRLFAVSLHEPATVGKLLTPVTKLVFIWSRNQKALVLLQKDKTAKAEINFLRPVNKNVWASFSSCASRRCLPVISPLVCDSVWPWALLSAARCPFSTTKANYCYPRIASPISSCLQRESLSPLLPQSVRIIGPLHKARVM